jgi:hypothetical protein
MCESLPSLKINQALHVISVTLIWSNAMLDDNASASSGNYQASPATIFCGYLVEQQRDDYEKAV